MAPSPERLSEVDLMAALEESLKPERRYVGDASDGYAEALYIWQTPYDTVREWQAAILAAIPEDERCLSCHGRGRTVILASNGGPGEFPVCWACEGSRRKETRS